MRIRRIVMAWLAVVVLVLGLVPAASFADDGLSVAPHPDGTYAVPGLEAAVMHMYHFNADESRVVIKGDDAWLITVADEASTINRYDAMAYGPQSAILDPTDASNKTLIEGTPMAMVVDEPDDGSPVQKRYFILPVPRSVLDSYADIYYMVRYRPGYGSGHNGDYYKAGGGDYYFTGYGLSYLSSSTDLPGGVQPGGGDSIDGTYRMYDLDTKFGMPAITAAAQNYFSPIIIVKDGKGTMYLPSGTWRYDHMALGTLEDMAQGKTVDVAGSPLYNSPLKGALSSDVKGYIFAFPLTDSLLSSILDGKGATLPFLVRYVAGYSADHDADWYQADTAQLSFKVEKKNSSTTAPARSADYTAVIKAVASVPADLSLYAPSTVAPVSAALAAIDVTKKDSEQAAVDKMAADLRTAVAGLGKKADYTAVDAALAKVPADLSAYTTASAKALFDARDAVVSNLTVDRQAAVDKMVAALEAALAGLTEQYEPVRDAIRALPLPKNVKASDGGAIRAAQAAYDALSDAQKAKINDNLRLKLTNAIKALDQVQKASTSKAGSGKSSSGSTSAKPGTTHARTGNQAAIAAALSGRRGAAAAGGSAGNGDRAGSATDTDKARAGSDARRDGSGDADGRRSESADGVDDAGGLADDGATDASGRRVRELNQVDGADASDGAESADGDAHGSADQASMAPSIAFYLIDLAIVGAVLFASVFAYRNRRAVKVRY